MFRAICGGLNHGLRVAFQTQTAPHLPLFFSQHEFCTSFGLLAFLQMQSFSVHIGLPSLSLVDLVLFHKKLDFREPLIVVSFLFLTLLTLASSAMPTLPQFVYLSFSLIPVLMFTPLWAATPYAMTLGITIFT